MRTMHKTFLLLIMFAVSSSAIAEEAKDSKSARHRTALIALPAGLAVQASSGLLSYDSNVYQAPKKSYWDYFAGQQVDPRTYSAYFIPIDVALSYQYDKSDKLLVRTSFDAGMEKYFNYSITSNSGTDQAVHENADSYKLDYVLGMDIKPNDRLLFALDAFASKRQNNYTDHDDGSLKLDNGSVPPIDISMRYRYVSTGVEAALESNSEKIDFGVNVGYEYRDHDDPIKSTLGDMSERATYDHYRTMLGAETSIKINKMLSYKLGYDFQQQVYADRAARDLTGKYLRSKTNYATYTRLKYHYHSFSNTLRARPWKFLIAHLDFDWEKREDQHLGYNDYTALITKLRLKYKAKRFEFKYSYAYEIRDYPNAWAFDRGAQGIRKTYDSGKWKFDATYKINKQLELDTSVAYYDYNTSDSRYQFERTIVSSAIQATF